MIFDRKRALALAGAAALLGGCSGMGETTAISCPKVLILADAERFTQFAAGGGRDITDIVAEGEIAGFGGACEKTKTGVDVTLALGFTLERGAANADGVARFSYFVAVPAFYPEPAAKAVLPVAVAFPDNVAAIRHIDEEVTLSLPLAAGEGGAKYEIFVGFQLDDAQLRFNRQRAR